LLVYLSSAARQTLETLNHKRKELESKYSSSKEKIEIRTRRR